MSVRKVLWRSTWIGAGFVLAGLAIAIVDAAVYGSWYAAREPWIGAALSLLVIGLLVTDVAGTAWILLAAPWWAKLLVLAPAAVAGLWWFAILAFGVATTGFGGPARDVRTIIYSVPEYAMAFVVLPTLAIVAIAAMARLMTQTRVTGPGDADKGS